MAILIEETSPSAAAMYRAHAELLKSSDGGDEIVDDIAEIAQVFISKKAKKPLNDQVDSKVVPASIVDEPSWRELLGDTFKFLQSLVVRNSPRNQASGSSSNITSSNTKSTTNGEETLMIPRSPCYYASEGVLSCNMLGT